MYGLYGLKHLKVVCWSWWRRRTNEQPGEPKVSLLVDQCAKQTFEIIQIIGDIEDIEDVEDIEDIADIEDIEGIKDIEDIYWGYIYLTVKTLEPSHHNCWKLLNVESTPLKLIFIVDILISFMERFFSRNFDPVKRRQKHYTFSRPPVLNKKLKDLHIWILGNIPVMHLSLFHVTRQEIHKKK